MPRVELGPSFCVLCLYFLESLFLSSFFLPCHIVPHWTRYTGVRWFRFLGRRASPSGCRRWGFILGVVVSRRLVFFLGVLHCCFRCPIWLTIIRWFPGLFTVLAEVSFLPA